jgi:hypothetical protein
VYLGICSLGRINDLGSTLVEHRMVIRFHTNANYFLRRRSHGKTPIPLSLNNVMTTAL